LPDSTQKVSQSLLGASWTRLPEAFARFNGKGLPESSGRILEEAFESFLPDLIARAARKLPGNQGIAFAASPENAL
jgi:hypothetical protein